MVDISSSAPVPPVPALDAGGGDRRRGDTGEERPRRPSPPPRRGIGDVAFVLGIPSGEMTPRVEEALTLVMREFDRIRHERDLGRDRIADLQETVEKHPFLPVLNRRGVIRHLVLVLERAATARTDNAFVCFCLRDGAAIRRRHGEAAARDAMVNAIQVIGANLRASDFIGALGGYDLGILLTLADAAAAEEKAAQIAEDLASARLVYERAALDLSADWGMYVLSPGDAPEGIIAAADLDLRVRIERRDR